jgi:hypothetical protein
MDVVLPAEDWDKPPPSCEACDAREMRQQFQPPAIGGSVGAKARRIAEDIIANDYSVADIQFGNRQGGTSKVRYKDQSPTMMQSNWGSIANALETAVAIGRETRLQHGNGLDILQRNLASGAQPDLIEASKRKAIKVW